MKHGRRSWMWLGLGLAFAACGDGQDVGDEADVIASAARKAEAAATPRAASKQAEVAGEVAGEAPEAVVSGPSEGELTCPRGGNTGPVRVSFTCETIVVVTCKDLSNLVIGLADGTRVRHEGQTGHTNAFAIPEGAKVVSVWVKAGANASGEGPGYGERVDAPEGWCIPPSTPAPSESETPEAPPADDSTVV
ncbi:MAG: hypothetical protein ABW252_21935 [Polyangiales bacterium]